MPKMTIEVEACNGCYKKDESLREATVEFTLDGRTWFLCREHEVKLSLQFVDMLGEPMEGGEDK